MIVVRSSTVVDVRIEQAGHHWADFVRQWRCDLRAGSVARTRVTLSVQLDQSPIWTFGATSPRCAEPGGGRPASAGCSF
jgi:hypothetical protein